MTIMVKICGISDDESLDACLDAGADWVGFVLFHRSPRHVTPEVARRLAARLPITVGAVALLVTPTDADIASVLATAPFAALQVYAEAQRAADIERRFGVPVWHARPIATRAELPATADTAKLLIEARVEGSDRPGGHGAPLDWSMFEGWHAPVSWMLAGGLTPANVAAAINCSGASAVDVSSGVERSPGRKDPTLIRAFVRAAKTARVMPQ